MLREHVLAMKAMWTERDAEFHGRWVDFDPVWVEPKPVSVPHPPIYIGAQSQWTIDRLVEYAEGWLPVGTPDLPGRVEQLRQRCDEVGRDVSSIDIAVLSAPGSPDDLSALAALGASQVIVSLPTLPRDESLAVLDGYANVLGWAEQLRT